MITTITGRTPMPKQEPAVRAHNFLEVPLGYTPEMARREASRCLQCRKPQCVQGCPVEVDIPGFLQRVAEGNFVAAARTVRKTNAFPAICGRVCPQESQCEARCTLGKNSEPVAIGRCERFVADYERENNLVEATPLLPRNGKRVAVVGAGPAGLTVASDLARLGYEVTIFEVFHKAGGGLMYGIPEFRLPKAIVDAEVAYLQSLGVAINHNVLIGKTRLIDELLADGFSAIFVGVGTGLPQFLGAPGEGLSGICSATEYLTRINLMTTTRLPAYEPPPVLGRRVCVVGGGNVAMDAARCAVRLGAESVRIVYRRGREEIPARVEEIHHAAEEGVQFLLLTNPLEYLGDESGRVCAMRCVQTSLGEPDASGRRRPIDVPNSEFRLDTDFVIVAAGAQTNPVLTRNTAGLASNQRGYIVTSPTGQTSKPRVWAGGNIVSGAATVILAMGAGRIVASDIHATLSGERRL